MKKYDFSLAFNDTIHCLIDRSKISKEVRSLIEEEYSIGFATYSSFPRRTTTTCLIYSEKGAWSGVAIKNPQDKHNSPYAKKLAFTRALDDMYRSLRERYYSNKPDNVYDFDLPEKLKVVKEEIWRCVLEKAEVYPDSQEQESDLTF